MALVYDKALYDSMYSAPAWQHGVRNVPRVPRHHYNWFVQMPRIQKQFGIITQQPGWASITHIALIGGGFGWTAELLEAAGKTVAVVEVSPHVINTIGTSEEGDLRQYLIDDGFDPDNIDFLMHPDQSRTLTNAEVWNNYWLRSDGVRSSVSVMDEDLSNNGSRRAVRQQLSNNMDAIVTELTLDGFTTEAEIDNFLDNVESLRPNPAVTPVHITEHTTQAGLGYITKTVADWRTYLDARGYNDHRIVNTMGVSG